MLFQKITLCALLLGFSSMDCLASPINPSLGQILLQLSQSSPEQAFKTPIWQDPQLRYRVGVELLAESLRQGTKTWPSEPHRYLDALITEFPEPRLQAAWRPGWVTDDQALTQMASGYRALTNHVFPTRQILMQQLKLCYQTQSLICEADLQARLGELESLPDDERLSAHLAGLKSAEKALHPPLRIVHLLALIPYVDDLEDEDEDSLILQAQTLAQQFPQLHLQESIDLVKADCAWEKGDTETAENLIESLLETAQSDIQAKALLLSANILESQGNSTSAQVQREKALAVYQKPSVLRRHLLQESVGFSLNTGRELSDRSQASELEALLKPDDPLGAELYGVARLSPDKRSDAWVEIIQRKPRLTLNSAEPALLVARLLLNQQRKEPVIALCQYLLASEQMSDLHFTQVLQMLVQASPQIGLQIAAENMGHPAYSVREATVQLLKQYPRPELLPRLKKWLYSSNDAARGNVIQVLWESEKKGLLPELVPLLQDPSEHVRNNALEALSQGNYALSFQDIQSFLKKAHPDLSIKAMNLVKQSPENRLALLEMAFSQETSDRVLVGQWMNRRHIQLTESEQNFFIKELSGTNPTRVKYAAQFLVTVSAQAFWPQIVKAIKAKPLYPGTLLEGADHAGLTRIQVLELAFLIPALSDSSQESKKLQHKWLEMFDRTDMQVGDGKVLHAWLKPGHSLYLPTLMILLRLEDPLAWQHFRQQLIAEAGWQNAAFKQDAYWSLIRNTSLPCLPFEAYLHAMQWLPQVPPADFSQSHLFFHWMATGKHTHIWNGAQCAPFNSFATSQQTLLRDSLQALNKHPSFVYQELALKIRKAWAL